MDFLNPAFLVSLAAVGVPLIIHLFSRRRVPDVHFSTLRFLKRSTKRSMRRVSMQRLLLLALRCAAIAMAALAFSRPVVRGGLAALFPPGGSRAACVLIDRSYSMRMEGDHGSLFERAKSRCSDVMDNLDGDDEVTIVLFDTGCETVYGGSRLERGVAQGTVMGLEPSWRGTDLRSAVETGIAVLGESRREVKELFIISDFQRTAIGGRGGVSGDDAVPDPTERGRGESVGEPASVKAFLLPVSPAENSNVAVESVLTPRVALHTGEIITIEVRLRNTSTELRASFPLLVFVDGRRIVEKGMELAPGVASTEKITFSAERSGWPVGEVRKGGDRLAADDRRYFTMHVTGRTRTLLVTDDSGFYLEQALSPRGSEGDIELWRTRWAEFTSSDLAGMDALVLGPGGSLQRSDIELVERFIISGGRVLVLVLPEHIGAIGGLSAFDPDVSFRKMQEGFVTVRTINDRSGVFSPFDEDDIVGLKELRFRSYAVVRGVPADAVLLGFGTGTPFLWRERRGEGMVVFAAVDPVPEAGDLLLSPYFLPVVQQSLLAAVHERQAGEGRLVGDALTWRGRDGGGVLCMLPSGSVMRPQAQERHGMEPGDVIIRGVEEPGFVTIYSGADTLGRMAVNPDCRLESEIEPVECDEAAGLLGLDSYAVFADGVELASAVRQVREGREISLPLFLAAALILVVELLVAQAQSGRSPEQGNVG